MKKITDIFKKPEPVVEEKPKMSLTQMKIKYGLFSKKCDEFIKKYQEMADKKIQRATELKLKGLNANVEIKAFAGYQAKIAGIEKRRSIFQRQIEMAEEADMQKELLGLLGDMVGVISDSYINADEIAEIILIGNRDEIFALAEKLGLKNIDKATIIDPATSEKTAEYTNLLYELRKNKGMTPEKAAQLVLDPLYFGCLIIKSGDADGQISGALSTTGETLRPALQIIKCAPGITCVSGAMLMITQTPEYGENGVLVVGDVAVTPMPDASQLAQIAVCTAQTAKSVAGFADPKVAMLSFSTMGSAKHEVVDKVIEATKLARELDPALKVEGELQADAALVASVGQKKAPGSEIAGHANVLVFPCLEVGNIAYKLVQRLGNADAIGPILQGIARPVNDLSRGCSVDDIYKMVAITACQAMDAK